MQIKNRFGTFVSSAILFCGCYAPSATAYNQLYTDLQTAVDHFQQQYQIPAVQVSISLPNQQKYSTLEEYSTLDFIAGTTILHGKNQLTPGDLFQFGSNTKSFTAAIILQLEAEGKLSIDDPIGKYFPHDYPQWKNITIRQLLNHTSGIFNYTEDTDFQNLAIHNPTKSWYPKDMIAFAAKHPVYFKPGASWHYSNTNFVLAGMIIEQVTRHTYTYEINHRLLGTTNLNISNTSFAEFCSADTMSHMVHSYYMQKTPKGIVYNDITYPNVSMAWSAGGIVGNTHDFVRWPRMLFQQERVLPAKQLEEMQQLVCDDSSICKLGQPVSPQIGGYGKGIFETRFGKYGNLMGHDGGIYGYCTLFIWVPLYNTLIAIALNAVDDTDCHIGDLLLQILAILYPSSEWQDYRISHDIPYATNMMSKESIMALKKLLQITK